MRLKISCSKNAASLYVIKSTYVDGKHSSKIVEKLGTYDELLKKLDGQDPIEWAKKYIEELNRQEKEENRKIIVPFSTTKLIEKDEQHIYNGGYLFLQQIYHQLGLHKISKEIADRNKFTFNLDSILSRLIYARIIFPSSKLATYEVSKLFLEKPDFELHHIYRGLEVIAAEADFIQAELYKNSVKTFKRNSRILYYDCTNYFFEIEREEGLKQYGVSKEHRPNPIVQMGLFMDGDGIPLAFSINKGNTNEQATLKPLEQKILGDFGLSKLVVCTDAGLSSYDNRKFNNKPNRAFITTQSLKQLKAYLREWALDSGNWQIIGSDQVFDITKVNMEQHRNTTFYKSRWINENDLEQRLVVTFSPKYAAYQQSIRDRQVERAQKLIETNPTKLEKSSANDYKRFISKKHYADDGEIADKTAFGINTDRIAKEAEYDGFYAICTNLEDEISEIVKINHRRWEIEESFRIMKTDFKARPVYLQRDDRILAHFTTCFLSLVIYRLLEKKLQEHFTNHEIIHALRHMNFYKVVAEGFVPAYTRTDLTDALHDLFGFRTDYQIISNRIMKKNFTTTKK